MHCLCYIIFAADLCVEENRFELFALHYSNAKNELLRFVHNWNNWISNYFLLSIFWLCFARHYTASLPKTSITTTSSLESIIKELQIRAKSKSRLSNEELKSVLHNVRTQRIDSTQSLEILKCCTDALTDGNQSDIVNEIWNELKKHNVFNDEHYHCYLRFARDKRDANRAQDIFAEMVKAGIKPDT